LEARFHGYWFAATSIPCARASSMRRSISGIFPKFGA
jgi:hypothetical protein